MKTLSMVISALILVAIAAFYILGIMSQSGTANGLVEGRLTRCPDSPNCVCSEYQVDQVHSVEALAIAAASTEQIMVRLKNILREMGGSIETEAADYLAATFTSAVFGFVDDLEIRIDTDQKLIHLRSASRVGYSDRGANRNRVEQLKKLFLLRQE